MLALFTAFAVYAGCFGAVSDAKADILITPTRVVFEDRDRFAVVTLVNSGDKVMSYKMDWRFFKMKETGPAYTPVDGAITEFDLSKHIIFSPKRVTLAPGASQKVRLALRRPETIPDGDYHIHLGFASVREELSSEVTSSTMPRAGATVRVNVGYTIPVILRAGKVEVSANIERISLSRNQNNGLLIVKVPVVRSGAAYSVLGHIFVYHIDGNGNEERVGEISNAHIFPEVNKRVFDIQLIKEITSGHLRVVMKHYDKDNDFIYTEKTFPIE